MKKNCIRAMAFRRDNFNESAMADYKANSHKDVLKMVGVWMKYKEVKQITLEDC